jgi:hypothetical protein
MRDNGRRSFGRLGSYAVASAAVLVLAAVGFVGLHFAKSRLEKDPIPLLHPLPSPSPTAFPRPQSTSPFDSLDVDRRFGMERLQVWTEGGRRVLPLILTSTARCKVGDLDIIRHDLDATGQSGDSLLLTLDSLDGGRLEESYAATVPLADFIKGARLRLSLPRTDHPRQFGLYLCGDKGRTGSCAGKPLVDMGSWSGGAPGLPNEGGWTDKTYFFTYLLVDSVALRVLGRPLASEDYASLAESLAPGMARPDDAQRALDSAARLAGTLTSMPSTIRKHGVVIDLPRLDRSLCAGDRR